MIRVYVVDARELVRRGLGAVITEVDDIEIVGEAPNAAAATDDISSLSPDIVIIDLDLPDGLAIDLCGRIVETDPAVRVIVSASRGADDRIGTAMLAGAAGYLVATAPAEAILDRIRSTDATGTSLDAEIVGDLFDRLRSGRTSPEEPLATLTERERQILDLLAEGLTNRRIGEALHLSPKTVKNYVSVILKKLGMNTRTEAAVYAARRSALSAPLS